MAEWVGLAVPAILAVVGVVALTYAVRIGRGVAREGTWPTHLAAAADGVVVEIAGRLVDGVRTTSPLLHRPCVWWRVQAATHSTGGRYRNGIHTTVHVDVASEDPVVLECAEGLVHVDVRGGHGDITLTRVHQDQAIRPYPLDVTGRRYVLPPSAYGHRVVREAVLVAGPTCGFGAHWPVLPAGPSCRRVPGHRCT